MAFADPQTVTYGAPITTGPHSLPRTSVVGSGSTYQSSDGLSKLSASHQYGKRTRRLLRLDYSKISADVYLPDTNVKKSMSVYLVFDLPADGFSNAEALAVYDGFRDQISASSDALVTKLLGGES